MPNQLDSTGLTVKTLSELTAQLVTAMQGIFGSDINVDSNSPDGQLINIFAQAALDNLELILDVYNSFTVAAAYGSYLDQRVALNGLKRRAGTYTITPVTITVDRALNLVGLDALVANPSAVVFTVADDAGNQFQLVTSQSPVSAGSNVYSFQAKTVGQVQTTLNTITNQITTILGVTAVNNPSVVTSLGVNEETDVQLKARHAQMFALGQTGSADSIQAALLGVADIVDAIVVENDTNGTVNTVPAHGIWVVVEGGTSAEIGTAIYNKKSPGCDMKGSTTYVIARPNGQSFTAKWDAAIYESLYVHFGITPKHPSVSFNTTAIKAALVLAFAGFYKLNQSASIGDIVQAMFTISPDGILTGVGVSIDNMSFVDVVAPSDAQHKFSLVAANITIS